MPFNKDWDAHDNLGNGYMYDEWPHRKQYPYDQYVMLPPLLDMPTDMLGVQKRDGRGPFGSLLMDPPINAPMFCMMEFQIAKEWPDSPSHGTITDVGHIFWVNFRSIPPSWFLVDSDEAYKILTEEQYGHNRPAKSYRTAA